MSSIIIFSCLLLLAGFQQAVSAATFTVTASGDTTNAGDGVTTLREAITTANNTVGNDVIDFNPTLFSTAQTITLNGGVLSIDSNITITGPSAQLTISGNNANRIMSVANSRTVVLSDLIIADGRANNSGGGIENEGNLTLINCTLRGNTSNSGGGGLDNNHATVMLNGCTLNGNTTGSSGGGLFNEGGTATLNNCTISGNTSGSEGGGIQNQDNGTLILNACTISGNASANGGGLFTRDGTVTLASNLIALNTASVSGPDVGGTIASNGYNLVGKSDGSTGFTAGTDQKGTINIPLNPGVQRDPNDANKPLLQNNGGTTATIALLSTSLAVDKGNINIAYDQRGRFRPYDFTTIPDAGNGVDIGAFELQDSTLLVDSIADTNDGTCGATNGCTLREALLLAGTRVGDDTISFAASVFGVARQTISLTGGQLPTISSPLTINGPSVGLTINAHQASRVFEISNSVVSMSKLNIINGEVTGISSGGGLNQSAGTLVLNSCTFSGNKAPYGGGLATSNSITTLNNCTFSGNTAVSNGGGGIDVNDGTVTINNCTVSRNNAENSSGAGGIYQLNSATVAVKSSVIALNTVAGPRPDVNGTFISGGFNLIGKKDNSTGFTAATDQTGTIAAPLNPLLATTLTNNGGPVPTFALLAGSPAVDKGQSALTTDARALLRPVELSFVGNALGGDGSDIGAYELQSSETSGYQGGPSFVVTETDDSNSGCTNDSCSLREALTAANAIAGNDTVTFKSTVFGTTPQTIVLGGNELYIFTNVTITGPGVGVMVDANQASRVFEVATPAVVVMSNLSITNGKGPFHGPGIFNGAMLTLNNCSIRNNTVTTSADLRGAGIFNAGTLTMTSSTISGNTGGSLGGGIYNSGIASFTNCTVDGNTSSNYGGGIFALGTTTMVSSTISHNVSSYGGGFANYSGGTSSLTNCTLSENTASSYGGAIINSASSTSLSVLSCTIAHNTSPDTPGILNDNPAAITLSNTLIGSNILGANPLRKSDATGAFSSGGYNLIASADDATGLTNGTNHDMVGTVANPLDPRVAAASTDNGGPTRTVALLPGSPAVDKGKSSLTTDGRGLTRPVDLALVPNADGGNGSDIGAFELQNSEAGAYQSGPSYIVTKTADTDNDCTTDSCSLREAIAASNTRGGTNTITFAPAVFGTTPQTIIFSTGNMIIDSNLTINGPSVGVIIDANHIERIFFIGSNNIPTVQMSNLTLRNGQIASNGGAIYINQSAVSLTNCTLSDNNTSSATKYGGAIYNYYGSLALTNCTLNNNTTSASGGGIMFNGGTGTFYNCTFTGNTADRGSAISLGGEDSFGPMSLTLENCTISGNISTDTVTAGSVLRASTISTLSVKNSLIALNTAPVNPDVAGSFVSNGYNLIGDTTGSTGFTAPTDQTGTNANPLNPGVERDPNNNTKPYLRDNGGLTKTVALRFGSLAIDKGQSSLTTDQRGLTRPVDTTTFTNASGGDGSDIGAYELQLPVLDLNGSAAGADHSVTFTEDGGAKLLATSNAFLNNANGEAITNATVTLNATPNGASESLTADTTGTTLTANYSLSTRTLRIAGTGTPEQYLQVLKTVSYNNISQDPTSTTRTVTFRVSDRLASGNPAITTITIVPINDAPTFSIPGNLSVAEDSVAYSQSWTTNKSAVEAGQTLTWSVTNSNPSLFSVQPALAINDTFTFTPAPNANGSVIVTVQLKDNGGTTNGGQDATTTTFTLTITAVNDAPIATDQQVSTPEDTPLAVTLTATDIDNVTLTYAPVTQPGHGTLSGSGATLTYTPAADFTGSDSFTFKANDGVADSNVATVTITVGGTNDAPVAVNDSYTVNGSSLTIAAPGVLGNDSDPDGDSLQAVVATNPAQGTLALNADGSFTYTAAAGFNGSDSFTYRVSDGIASATATVTLTVQNNAPVIPPDKIAPTVTFTSPINGARLVRFPSITGTTRDNIGVQKVLLTLRRSSDGKYWNGSSWTTQTTLNTTLTGAVTQRIFAMKAALPAGANLLTGVYLLSAVTFDDANNRGQSAISFRILDLTAPATTVTTPRTGTSTAALREIRGTVTDEATGSGISHVFLFIRRSSDGKYWAGRNWAPTLATLRTTLSGTGRALNWVRTTELPPGPATGSDIYYITAAGYDRSGNRSTKTISITALAAAGARTTETTAVTSRVALSTSSAAVATQSIALKFNGALDADSISGGSYLVSVNGQTTTVEGINHDAATSTVKLILTEDSFKSGDHIDVIWSGLLDVRGGALQGQIRIGVR